MSACKNLPLELIEAIVDNLQGDKKSLKAFSLVCKTWTNPARNHLFASLDITDVGVLEKIKAANIASTYTMFLRHLCLATYLAPHEFWREVASFFEFADLRTPRLRSLKLNLFACHSLSLNGQSAFLRQFDSIISLELSVEGLKSLDVSSDIATIICSFPRLRNLDIKPSLQGHAFFTPAPLSPELRLPERLSTLCLWYLYQEYRLLLEWLGSIPGPLPIRNLELVLGRLCPRDRDSVNGFLKALGPCLEKFRCDYDAHLSIDLMYNTRLRRVDFWVKELDDNFPNVLPAISSLSRMGSRQLEQVIFRCGDPSWSDWGFADMDWNRVDAILAKPQFATLKDVRICPDSLPPDLAELSALFATLLPTCHARGIISFADPPPW